jgi:serine/threonine protein kinase
MASTASPRPIPDGIPKKGTILAGKYQVEELLGQGGMGVVVSAVHVSLRQRVAIKFLLPGGQPIPDAAARFLREAQAAVAIQSEHVTRVLDVGTLEDGSPYMVMEHLSGTDLWSLLKARGPLPFAEVVELVLQAGEALAEAHVLGIVHRDLKPTNLFLTRRSDGSALMKVLDFGLSKVLAPELGEGLEESMTRTNIVVGSPHYMSPEQIRSLKHVDARTDIWALGVILYHLVSGRRPFGGDSLPAVCMSIAVDTPPPLPSLVPDVPPAFDQLVSRCLEKNPAQRVQSVAELAQGLAPFAPPSALVSVERIVKVAASGHERLLSRGPSSAGRGLTPAVRPSVELPTMPSGIWGPQPTTRDQREFVPWLQAFDAFVREHRAELKMDDASVSLVVTARSRLDDAIAEQDQAALAAGEAEEALRAAQAELAAAEERRGAASTAAAAAVKWEGQALHKARGLVLPIVERLLEHDDLTNAVRRRMGLMAAVPAGQPGGHPQTAGPLPTYMLAEQAAASPSPIGAPANVVVVAHPNRVNVLSWLGDGIPGTTFLVEAAVGTVYRGSAIDPDPHAYRRVATVAGETTYTHAVPKCSVGVRVRYRIRAERNGVSSAFSGEVTVACK